MSQKQNNIKVSEADYVFMSSLSQASLEKPTVRSQLLVWSILLVVIWLVVWASFAELDKIVRGDGKVVPPSQIQVIQNLEGGIIEELYFQSGDKVKKGDILLKLDNTQFASSYGESQMRASQLRAKAQRLTAEAFDKPLTLKGEYESSIITALYDRERNLYDARQKQLKTQTSILEAQVQQHKLELQEAYSQQTQLTRSHKLLTQEINMMKPLVRQGIASEVDLLKIQRQENDALTKLKTTQNNIPKLHSIIAESESKLTQAHEEFMNKAHEELNETLAEISQIEQSSTALKDRVKRTEVMSPVNGTIKQLLVNTIGGVVQPGSDIVEIVPEDDSLVLETKILPADIGFIYPGLKAKLKFTAYDFAIYGGLDGTVTRISADTITDEEGNSYYIARIKTDKNFLGTEKDPLYLLPGMTASVDIIVGKHTVLEYIIKPIIRAKDLALRES